MPVHRQWPMFDVSASIGRFRAEAEADQPRPRARKRPIDALDVDIGHCLWTGIVDTTRRAGAAPADIARDVERMGGSGRSLVDDGYKPSATTTGVCGRRTPPSSRPGSPVRGATTSGGSRRRPAGRGRAGVVVPPPRALRRHRCDEIRFGPLPDVVPPRRGRRRSPLLLLRGLLGLEPDMPNGVVPRPTPVPVLARPGAHRGLALGAGRPGSKWRTARSGPEVPDGVVVEPWDA